MTTTGNRIWELLTKRERQILLAICTDPLPITLIADKLGLKRETMGSHINHLGEKMGMSTRMEIMFCAWTHRMVPCPCGEVESK